MTCQPKCQNAVAGCAMILHDASGTMEAMRYLCLIHLDERELETMPAAESNDLALLVVGSHGYGPIGSALLGSVAASCCTRQHAPCW